MAHFLEHLVFKGGEKYDDYRKVNETAERMGAVLNAYTSHDLVAFHITCRAEVVGEAIDLLTDFVGRPKVDADELDRERGVVIQEIARANDQPSMVAEHLIDRAAFGDHPLGRPVLGPEEHLRTFTRDAIVAFRRRQWAGARGGAFLVGNLEHVPENQELVETFGRFPSIQANGALRAGARVQARRRWSRSATPTSRTCASPTARRSTRATRASAPRWPSTARCSAARWARACSTRSASSAASPTPSTPSTTRSPTCRSCSSRPGLDSAQVHRGLPPHARDRRRAAHGRPDRGGGRARPRVRRRAARARVREHERGRAPRRGADGRLRPGDRPRRRDRRARRGHASTRSPRSPRGISEAASVACVGPHDGRRLRRRCERRFAVPRSACAMI